MENAKRYLLIQTYGFVRIQHVVSELIPNTIDSNVVVVKLFIQIPTLDVKSVVFVNIAIKEGKIGEFKGCNSSACSEAHYQYGRHMYWHHLAFLYECVDPICHENLGKCCRCKKTGLSLDVKIKYRYQMPFVIHICGDEKIFLILKAISHNRYCIILRYLLQLFGKVESLLKMGDNNS